MIDVLNNRGSLLLPLKSKHPTQESWYSLYTIGPNQSDQASLDLMHRYSRYKYGDIREITTFSEELGNEIEALLGKELKIPNRDQWVLFTPPYSTIEPAVYPLGENLAAAFSIPHGDFRTSPDGDRASQYATITDASVRLQAKLSAQPSITNPATVRGKHALVIDDMITTGTTMAYMDRTLRADFGVQKVVAFSLVDLITSTPSSEEYINRFLIHSGNFDELVSILNNLRFRINRHILKSFYGLDKETFEAVKDKLNPSFLAELSWAADRYYGNYDKYNNF